MNIKKILSLVLSVVMVLSTVTITTFADKSTSAKATNEEKRGNSIGNIANGGAIAIQGNYIYYSNLSDNCYLYKETLNGKNKTKLSDDEIDNINVIDDWIYYRNRSDNDYIYKIKIDGTNRKKICKYSVARISVVDDYIYYSRPDKSNYVYVFKTDGTEHRKIKLCSEEKNGNQNYQNIFCVSGGWIYYYGIDCNGTYEDKDWFGNIVQVRNLKYGVYKIKIDGTGKKFLYECYPKSIVVSDGWIYYTTNNYSDSIHKIDVNGLNNSKICSDTSIRSLNITNNWIYYVCPVDNEQKDGFATDKVFRISKNGTAKKEIFDDYKGVYANSDDSMGLHIYGNYVYCKDNNYAVMKINAKTQKQNIFLTPPTVDNPFPIETWFWVGSMKNKKVVKLTGYNIKKTTSGKTVITFYCDKETNRDSLWCRFYSNGKFYESTAKIVDGQAKFYFDTSDDPEIISIWLNTQLLSFDVNNTPQKK